MSNNKLILPTVDEMLSIFVDKEVIPKNLIIPYYRLAKDISSIDLKPNSIFFISNYKELKSFKTIYNVLTEKQKYVIIEYYGLFTGNPKTLNEIAIFLNLSKSRVGQLRKKALFELSKSRNFESCCTKHLKTLSNYYKKLSNYYANEILKYSDELIENLFSKTDIEYLGLPVRTNNALKRYGYKTIEDVRKMTKEDLKCIRNIGPKARNIIWQKIHGTNFE